LKREFTANAPNDFIWKLLFVYIYRDFEVAELDPGMELSSKLQLAEL
jgi:hypothetical protein